MEKSICDICKCQFQPRTDKVNKCINCNRLYPDANTLEEVRNKTVANKDVVQIFTREKIESIVHDVLNKVGINLKECEKCKSLFYPKSPAQKFCRDCSAKKTKETKTEDVKGIENA